MKTIKYIGFYDTDIHSKEERNYALSARNKMDSIVSELLSLGFNVDIISMCSTRGKYNCSSRFEKLSNKVTLKCFYTLGRKNIFFLVLNRIIMFIQFAGYLMYKVKRNEKIIVYHIPIYMNIISAIVKIKKAYLILEFEEIYGDVQKKKKLKNKEMKYSQIASAYIFPSELIADYINSDRKLYAVMYGTYDKQKQYESIFHDGLIHCVFAGTFFESKGVIKAIDSAAYLPSNYHIHIIGFGSDKEVEKVNKHIEQIKKNCLCKISYDGCLTGEEYAAFLQSCHIGLSTQLKDSDFNETSFPSKISSYIVNGLRVVSIRLRSIEKSKLGKYIYFYENDSGKEIAETIKRINMNDMYDGTRVIDELKKDFENQILKIIS